jgi:hypothetical protein
VDIGRERLVKLMNSRAESVEIDGDNIEQVDDDE